MNAVLDGDARWIVEHSDALSFLKTLPDCSVDSLVTDPPAGIGFMGRDWDKNKGDRDKWIAWLEEIMREVVRVLKPGAHGLVWALPRTSHWTAFALENAGFEIRDCFHHAFGSGFPKSLNVSKAIDAAAGAEREVIGTMTLSGTAAMSLEEKGGTYSSGIASNGHKKTIEITAAATDAAKQWDGWGTALKPSHEDWWLVRKPVEGTVAECVQKYGTGAINVDACRVGCGDDKGEWPETDRHEGRGSMSGQLSPVLTDTTKGRWPSNLLLSHSADCICLGMRSVKSNPTWDTPNRVTLPSSFTGAGVSAVCHDVEEIDVWQCVDDCPIFALDQQSEIAGSHPAGFATNGHHINHVIPAGYSGGFKPQPPHRLGDTGTASRFFPQFAHDPELDDPEAWPPFLYAAKPSRAERDAGLEHFQARTGGEATGREDDSAGTKSPRAGAGRNGGAHNVHPTVKRVSFIQYLQRLVTPPNGVTLDIFVGSGTHAVAAYREGFRFLGCELNDTDAEPFVSIARARVTHAEGRTFIPRESLRTSEPPRQTSLF